MEYLFIIVLILLANVVANGIVSKPDTNKDIDGKLVVKAAKQCPPHQWFWQEVVDQNGVKQNERMVCKLCGPLSKSLNGE